MDTFAHESWGVSLHLKRILQVLGVFRGTSSEDKQGNTFSKRIYESFGLLFRTLQLSWGRISGGRRELQYSVCGRLVKLKESNAILNKYVESLLKYTEKPYLVPVTPFFPDPRSGELMDIVVGNSCLKVCCSPCGRYIAALTVRDVFVLDAFSGAILRRLEQPGAFLYVVMSIAFALNSKKIAISVGTTIRLWAWKSCKSTTQILKGHEGTLTCIAVSSDGERVFSGSIDGTLRVWDACTGAATAKYRQGPSVHYLALSSNDQKIAVGLAGGALKVLESCTGAPIFEGRLDDGVELKSVAFCPSGLYFAAGSSTHVHIWSTQTWMLQREMMVGSVHSVAFSPNGKHIVAGLSNILENEVCMWNVETGAVIGIIPTTNLHSCVHTIAFSNDGKRVILGSEDGRVRVWDSQLC